MSSSTSEREPTVEVVEGRRLDPAVMASAASVLLALYYFYVRGDRERGLFVGLWPPTILAFANYFKQSRTNARVEQALGNEGTVRQSLQRLVERR